jgi:hypothetical protein
MTPDHPRSGAALLWQTAGRPDAEQAQPVPPGTGCWWCGTPIPDRGRPTSTLPDSFHATIPRGPADLSSDFLCHACGWSLSDWVALPRAVWGPQLAAALDGDGKVSLSLGGDRGAKASICRGPGSTVYVFARPPQGKRGAPLEAAWMAGRGAAATGDLSAMPPELALLATLDEAEVGAAMVGKFRNYDHLAVNGEWHALKVQRPADRDRVRALLLAPPPGLWALSLGDGQKHCAFMAPLSDGRLELQSVYCDGAGVVCYAPRDLAGLLEAVGALIVAGAHPDEVRSGRYRPRGDVTLMLARARWDAAVAVWRGSALYELAETVRPSTDALREAAAAQAPQAAPQTPMPAPAPVESPDDRTADPGPGVPGPAAGTGAGAPAAARPRADRPAQRQLGLFG